MYTVLLIEPRARYSEYAATLKTVESVSRVVAASSGAQAIECLKKASVDMVFAVLEHARDEGVDACRQVRAFEEEIPMVVLSATPDFECARCALKLKCHDYLHRPFDRSKFTNVLCGVATKEKRLCESLFNDLRKALKAGDIRGAKEAFEGLVNSCPTGYAKCRKLRGVLKEGIGYYGAEVSLPVLLPHVKVMDTNTFLLKETFERLIKAIVDNKLATYNREIDYALNYIEHRVCERLTLEAVASYMNISVYYFSKFFKRKTGCNFVNYVTQRKMEIACSRLTQTEDSVVTIAYELGYAESNYFSKVFKKTFGIAPTMYRELH